MAAKDKAADTDDVSAEERSRQAMGKGPVSEGGDGGGAAVVPAPGGDPDSVQRVIKHLPQNLQDRLGANTPEEVSALRAQYGEDVNAQRNPQGPRANDGASDEEMARRTGQPIGDGKSTGAPSADDPGSGLREGKLTAGEANVTGRAAAAAKRQAAAVNGPTEDDEAGQSRISGRTATPPAKATTAPKSPAEENK